MELNVLSISNKINLFNFGNNEIVKIKIITKE